jgi:hypothetical protein
MNASDAIGPVTNQDLYTLAELRRKDPELALRIATLSAKKDAEK